jgi:2-oxoisovalerate dehydrogenase E1 component alpha subunit
VVQALDKASKVEKPELSCLFTDVLKDMPWHLEEQRQQVLEFAARHPEVVPPDVAVR